MSEQTAVMDNPTAAKTGTLFSVDNLQVSVEGKSVVKGISLTVKPGEKHAIMGPNGSGKSTLANALMGHPNYEITGGSISLAGETLTEAAVDERARAGMFLCMQYPVAIPGVTVANFMRSAVKAQHGEGDAMKSFRKNLKGAFKKFDWDQSFATRYINDGFSGGEKKRMEILQLSMLKPKLAILDEIDSGLDIDALKLVAEGINENIGEEQGLIMVTHYQRLLDYVKPTHVHVLMDGKLVRSGGPELAHKLEEQGYDWIEQELKGAK